MLCPRAQPADLDNWLLDVQLAHGEFRTDQVAIWLSELELGLEFTDVVQAHAEFFQAIKRKDALKRLLKADDTAGQIRLKMLAVCTGSEPRMDVIVEQLLDESSQLSAISNQLGEKYRLLQRCKLDGYFWEQMKRIYGYIVLERKVRFFVCWVEPFLTCWVSLRSTQPTEIKRLTKKDAKGRSPTNYSRWVSVQAVYS